MLFSLQEPFSNSGVPLNSIDVKVTWNFHPIHVYTNLHLFYWKMIQKANVMIIQKIL